MNNSQLAQRFYGGATKGNGSNMFIQDDCLYSYGTHFILAKRKDDLFLLNGDKYSNTTAKHQNNTREALPESPTTSFMALNSAGINLDALEIIDFTQDKSNESVEYGNFEAFKKTIPNGATVSYSRDKDTKEITRIFYHLAGSILIKHGKKHYVCGMDDNSYFVSELPCKVDNVQEAYEALKPQEVKDHEKTYPDDVIHRQGEWFFIPVHELDAKRKNVKPTKRFVLPTTDSQSNLHTVTKAFQTENGDLLCSGTVRHGQHKMLKLGNVIHRAVCNTAVNNWSVSGVD